MDFSHTKREAFVNGLMKGLTAPSMLFGQHEMPKLQEVRTVCVPTSLSDSEELASDWKAIGVDFFKAIGGKRCNH